MLRRLLRQHTPAPAPASDGGGAPWGTGRGASGAPPVQSPGGPGRAEAWWLWLAAVAPEARARLGGRQ